MKKLIVIILLILTLCFFNSCGIEALNLQNCFSETSINKNEQTQEESNYQDNVNNIQFYVSDVPIISPTFKNENPDKEKTITFEGSTKKINYLRTEDCSNLYYIDFYSEENSVYTFKFNNETGEFLGYGKLASHFSPDENSVLKTENELLEIATEEIKKYEDISGYGYCINHWGTVTNNKKNDEEYKLYVIWYYREFEGMKTNEGVNLVINEYGTIYGLTKMNIGFYDNCFIPEYDKEAAESEMIEKAIEKYELPKDQITNIKKEFNECRISSEKKLVLIYKIYFTLNNSEGVLKEYPVEMAITIDADCYK